MTALELQTTILEAHPLVRPRSEARPHGKAPSPPAKPYPDQWVRAYMG